MGKRWHLGLVGWEEQSSGFKEGILLGESGLKAATCITLLFIGQSLATALYICGGTENWELLSHQIMFPFSLALYLHIDKM